MPVESLRKLLGATIMVRCCWAFIALFAISLLIFDESPTICSVAWSQTSGKKKSDGAGDATSVEQPAPAEAAAPNHDAPLTLLSAQQTVRTFIVSVEMRDYRTAISALDFSKLDPAPDSFSQIALAQRLKVYMDRTAIVEFSKISNAADGSPVPFPPDKTDSAIVISRGEDGHWRFTAKTIAEIDTLYEALEDLPPPGGDVINSQEPTVVDDSTKASAEADSRQTSKAPPTEELAVPDEFGSARKTMSTLFESIETKNHTLTVNALDFSELEAKNPQLGPYAKLEIARQLKEIIERMALVNYADISDDPQGPTFHFPPNAQSQPIMIARDEARVWRFSADTVGRVGALHTLWKDKPILNVADEKRQWYARQLVFGNETWRILALLAAIFVSLLIGQAVRTVLNWRGEAFERGESVLKSVVAKTFAKVAVGICFLVGLRIGVMSLVLEHAIENLVATMLQIVFTVVLGVVSFSLVNVVVEMLREFSKRSGSTLNNMLVPIVTYDTPPEKLQRALELLRDVLADHEGMENDFPPRVFLHEFLETAVSIRAIYWYHPPDYWDYCDFSERVNMQIVERFRSEGIPFALPTQRLFLERDFERP